MLKKYQKVGNQQGDSDVLVNGEEGKPKLLSCRQDSSEADDDSHNPSNPILSVSYMW